MFDREYASSTWRQFSRVVQIAGRKMGIISSPMLSSSIHFLPAILGSRNSWNTLVLAKNRFEMHDCPCSSCVESSLANKTNACSLSIDRSTFTAESSPPKRKFRLNWIEIVEIGIVGIRVASSEKLFRFRVTI